MAALACAFPGENLHVIDLPYRLSSWAFDDPENVGLWVDVDGRLVAWAVMQAPFWAIDYAYDPGVNGALFREILNWASDRASRILGTPSGHPCWFVNVLASQTERILDLEQMGFASQSKVGEDSWSKVLMENLASAANTLLPDGFTIRPLAGESELEAVVELHRAAFGTKSMTVEWRGRVLAAPEYISDLDLVVAAPDGRLAAFCLCWLNRSLSVPSGQIEPLGVHPDFRKLGLGHAVLLEGLRRLRARGAQRIFVETDNYRDAALELYESAGFRVIKDVLVYRKDFASRPY